MQVNTQNNNVSFTSIPLYKIKLPQAKGGGMVDATISKITQEDAKAIRDVKKNWGGKIEIVEDFCKKYFKNEEGDIFYAIEKSGSEPLFERLEALAMVKHNKNSKDSATLYYIFTNPDTMKNSKKRTVKNVGEALLGATFGLANDLKVKLLNMHSINNGFYSKTFERSGLNVYSQGKNSYVVENKNIPSLMKLLNKPTDINILKDIMSGKIKSSPLPELNESYISIDSPSLEKYIGSWTKRFCPQKLEK